MISVNSEKLAVTYENNAPSLSAHVASLKSKNLYVIGIFHVTSFETSDTATRAYRKGLELALLSLFAQCGVDDVILTGLPMGNDNSNKHATDYMKEVKRTWATIPVPTPALGVAMPPVVLQSDTNQADGSAIYGGTLTPGLLLQVCDYLALDMRAYGSNTQATDSILKGIQYAYVRYSLRLLMPIENKDGIISAHEKKFDRILECES